MTARHLVGQSRTVRRMRRLALAVEAFDSVCLQTSAQLGLRHCQWQVPMVREWQCLPSAAKMPVMFGSAISGGLFRVTGSIE